MSGTSFLPDAQAGSAARSSSTPVTLPGPTWPGVSSFVTTRQGGVSDAPFTSWNLGDHVGDDPARVAENRQLLAALLPGAPLWLQQVHGTDVVDADAGAHVSADAGSDADAGAEVGSDADAGAEAGSDADAGAHASADASASANAGASASANTAGGAPIASLHQVPCGDAAVTRTPGKVLAIMTADCLPVLLAACDGSVLAMAHAGWRGLAAGVLESTVKAMRSQGDGAALRAWIGPAIGPSAFEVGDEVRATFLADDPGASACFRPSAAAHKWMADLPELARRRLHAVGVVDVELSGYCTVTDADRFFSYRRDGQTGRFATVAWLHSET